MQSRINLKALWLFHSKVELYIRNITQKSGPSGGPLRGTPGEGAPSGEVRPSPPAARAGGLGAACGLRQRPPPAAGAKPPTATQAPPVVVIVMILIFIIILIVVVPDLMLIVRIVMMIVVMILTIGTSRPSPAPRAPWGDMGPAPEEPDAAGPREKAPGGQSKRIRYSKTSYICTN